MKIHIHFHNIDETFEAADAGALLSKLKQEAASRAPLLLRGMIKSMPDLKFAAEAVKRDNQAHGRHDPAPASAQQFLEWAVARGYVTILEQ